MNKTILIILLFTIPAFAFSQQSISGVVVNEKEEPVIAATVSVLKQDSTFIHGTVTNARGEFSLEFKSPENTDVLLRISSVGYKGSPVKVGSRHKFWII